MKDNERQRMTDRPFDRHSIRLKDYDYSQTGAYFTTIVTQDRACLFGDMVGGDMRLNDAGRMVLDEWNGLANRFRAIDLDAFVIMPNHIHGIILIPDIDSSTPAPSASPSATPPSLSADVSASANDGATTRAVPILGDMVGAFKSRTTVEYALGVRRRGWPSFRGRLWQRNYFEHIVRDELALNRIREYIRDNPMRWNLDRENPLTTPSTRG